MKVLIIATYLRDMLPFMNQYENILKDNKVKYDVFLWDRFNSRKLEKKNNEFIFHQSCGLGGSKWQKIYPYFLFRKTIKNILKDNSYDKIIVFNTLPAFFISDILLNLFGERYILDVRDYTYEKYNFYRKRILKLVENSSFTAISSLGFKEFLGEHSKLVVNHNIPEKYVEVFNPRIIEPSDVIKIGFVGTIRYFYENSALIRSLANDKRFELIYVGRSYEDCNLEKFCKENGYSNVKFFGEYTNEEKAQIYQDIDIINAVYGNKSLEVTTALPNRFYDALIFKKPILVSSGTYISSLVEKNNLGISIDLEDRSFKEKIVNYMTTFDYEKFCEKAMPLLDKIRSEQKAFHKCIGNFTKM